ncbi:hypothetical protein ACRAWD_21670 [Caulobacter segnis]
MLIDQLRPQDRVAMVAYRQGSAGAVLSPTDGRSKLKMRCALGALRAGGSTAGGQGLRTGLRPGRSRTSTRRPSIGSSWSPTATSTSASPIPPG